jgi:HAD superfamily hydrolase (TIGR01509 family)
MERTSFSRTIKLVIFDMDGTMLDTETLSLRCLMRAATEMGYEPDPDFYQEIIGRNAANARRVSLARYGEDFDYARALGLHHRYMDEHFEQEGIPVKPGLVELLDRLDALGIPKSVATSTERDRAVWKLTKAGVAHRFETIIGGDMVADSKPNPEIFQMTAAFSGADPAECLVLEDSAAGAQAAISAGMPLIIIPDIARIPQDLLDKATCICHDLHEVAALW